MLSLLSSLEGLIGLTGESMNMTVSSPVADIEGKYVLVVADSGDEGDEGEKEESDGDGDGGWMFYERLSRQGTVGHWPGVGGPRVRTPKTETETLGPSSSPPVANSDQTVTITGISPISSRPCHAHARCLPRHQRILFRRLSSLGFSSLPASRIICLSYQILPPMLAVTTREQGSLPGRTTHAPSLPCRPGSPSGASVIVAGIVHDRCSVTVSRVPLIVQAVTPLPPVIIRRGENHAMSIALAQSPQQPLSLLKASPPHSPPFCFDAHRGQGPEQRGRYSPSPAASPRDRGSSSPLPVETPASLPLIRMSRVTPSTPPSASLGIVPAIGPAPLTTFSSTFKTPSTLFFLRLNSIRSIHPLRTPVR
ncbi:hypothetical protein BDY19DRAFT_417899 [Irpex rosettiformis]|uniref:Uncharacterized protein n=1 Tax=Irpex rosettiformis TaxID=378272 RepID=A0ACB8UG44_9APHY|nr:hypothetical protein BDY19DRAFT_417899 [Irpex rosettiformis]